MLTLPMLNLHLITAHSHNLRLGEPFVFLSILLSVFARLLIILISGIAL